MAESDSVLGRARVVADTVLFPAAQDVDRLPLLPGAGLDALAAAGLFGIAGPVSHGGSDLDAHTARRVIATIGGGCGSTFFVWVQHHGVVRSLRASPNPGLVTELLAPMCAGEIVAGVAFAHVRRPGPPAVLATRNGDDDGWLLDGIAPWATSWGIAGRFAVAAVADDERVVWSMLPADAADGMRAMPLELPVFGSTGTVALTFEHCAVPDSQVIAVEDLAAWRRSDRRRAAIGQPAVLGLTERVIRLLGARAGDDDALAASDRLAVELLDAWSRDDALIGEFLQSDDDEDSVVDTIVASASDHRARCLHLARRATTALLAAAGGGGMDLSHPAQRLARESDFYVIQAQTIDGRAATLRAI